MPAKQLLCICQICNCGRHQCPHKPAQKTIIPTDAVCSLSEYSVQFKRYQAKRRSSFRPPQKPVASDSRMECSTTNRNDFVSHPITPPPPKPVVTYKPPEGTMEGSTEYKELYQGKWAVPTKPFRPPQARNNSDEPFNHQSTHSVEYVVHTLQPREGYGPKYSYETPKEPFNSVSTVKTDFVDYESFQPPKSLKPPEKPLSSTERMEAVSCYRNAFTPPAMPPRFQRPKEVYTPSNKEFCADTTFKSDFTAHYGIKPSKSLKPPQTRVASDQKFEEKTTSRMSYRKWELPTKVSRPPTVYSPPSEKFAVDSTYKRDFPIYSQFARTRSLRPAQQREELKPFEGTTSHGYDYKLWSNVERPSPVRLEKRYAPPAEKFEGISTFQAHYTGEFASRAASTKPQPPAYTKTSIMEASTSYRESYSSGYQPCPATDLGIDVSKHPGYEYSHEDSTTGHKFFSPAKDTPKIAIETVA